MTARVPLLAAASWLSVTSCGPHGNVAVETGAAVLDFISPQRNEAVHGSVAVELEPGRGVGPVVFSAGGAAVASIDRPPYVFELDVTGLSEGTVLLEARRADAKDLADTPLATVPVMVDNLGPAITIDAPRSNVCVSPGGSLHVAASVVEPAGVAVVEFRLGLTPFATFEGEPPFAHTHTLPVDVNTESLTLTVAAQSDRGVVTDTKRDLNVCR